MSNLDSFRAAGNPLFNDNKLKLGIFGSNCSNACAMTLAETSFEPTWEKNVEIARILERGGFECIVPIARWRGFGGPSNFNGNCMETYTWAAALAAVTERLSVRDFARPHAAPDRGGEDGDHDRPHLEGPLRAEHGLRLVHAGDGDVWREDDGARHPL